MRDIYHIGYKKWLAYFSLDIFYIYKKKNAAYFWLIFTENIKMVVGDILILVEEISDFLNSFIYLFSQNGHSYRIALLNYYETSDVNS